MVSIIWRSKFLETNSFSFFMNTSTLQKKVFFARLAGRRHSTANGLASPLFELAKPVTVLSVIKIIDTSG